MPRPSSPVHAKASTNCPYLTLESPHHQRQHWIDAHRAATRNSAEQCSVVLPGVLAERPPGADDYNLSQIVGYASPPNACASSVSRNPLVIEADLERRSFAPALRPTLTVVRPNRHHHGIDFKNPFTMSKRRCVHLQITAVSLRRNWCLHQNWIVRSGRWWSLSGSNR